ncbi:MAG: 4Fe-4S dicluster domain-containing protein [Myxococcota bacterium]|nr:4Fe-4S dicluster domain-containing protein [Myxococcota bacterium]
MADMNRRDFFKIVGTTSAVGALTACDPNTPVENLYPYVVQPEQVTPGVPTFFASTSGDTIAGAGVVLRNREGRVVFVGGNTASEIGEGGITAHAIAATQETFNPDHIGGPKKAGADTTWEEATKALADGVKAGGAVWLGRYRNGALDRLLGQVSAASGLKRVHWEPFGYESLVKASELAFGQAVAPSYEVSDAHVIVSFGADWLQTWLAPERHTKGYAKARDPKHGDFVAEFVSIEPRVSHTGTKCDQWLKTAPGTEAGVAYALAKLVADKKGSANGAEAVLSQVDPAAMASAAGVELSKLEVLADKLSKHPSVVFPGGVNTQSANGTHLALASLLLNLVCGNIGTSVKLGAYSVLGPVASFAEVQALLESCKKGEVKTLVIDELDPIYALPPELGVAEALKAVPNLFVFTNGGGDTRPDNAWLLPPGSWLEQWGDAEPIKGKFQIRQPGMVPQHDTMSQGDLLLSVARQAGLAIPAVESTEAPVEGETVERVDTYALGGKPATASFEAEDFYRYVAGHWAENAYDGGMDFQDWWIQVLQTGGFYTTVNEPEVTVAAGIPAPVGGEAISGDSLLFFPHVHLYDGRFAFRPWLNEVPHPVSGLTWTTWAEMSAATAQKLGVDNMGFVKVSANGQEIGPLNVRISKGMPDGHVAIPSGNGHENSGSRYERFGFNPVKLLAAGTDPVSGALNYLGNGVSVSKAALAGADLEKYKRVSLKGSEDMDNRPIALDAYAPDILEGKEIHLGHGMGIHLVEDPRLEAAGIEYDMFPEPEHPTYRWALSIDLDSCTGCGACEVACNSENNVPMTGPEQHQLWRYQGWIRLDRFWQGEGENPDVRYAMAICQQCAHAPCEGVCPVVATYHNLDGLNAMIYNRCVGTRYCANNCPYSARRFNWHTYRWPEAFEPMLNPDVVTREMGVMEKCTFCIQRVRFAKAEARPATVQSADVERLTACAEVCPADCIVFGNVKEEGSKVATLWNDPRSYQLLGELNTKNGVQYMAKLTHQEPHHGGGHGDGHGAAADHGDGHGEEHAGGHDDGHEAPAGGAAGHGDKAEHGSDEGHENHDAGHGADKH